MFVSIIIAVKDDNPCLKECIEHCLKLDYQDFEILVLPDKPVNLNYPKTTIIPTSEVTPPVKRDMAIDKASGEILAFLDDDAYPAKDWLGRALAHFNNPEVAAVGGPAITPESDTLRQKGSGLVYSSWLMSGAHNRRYLPKEECFVDDYPSCNFLVRKSVMRDIGGFNTRFWPGEDTFLCLKIVQGSKKKIVYDPRVLVYHHRRRLLKGHLKQIVSYALHRGYFVKRFPATSRKFAYFLPSFLVAGIVFGGIGSCWNEALRVAYFFTLGIYLLIVFLGSLSRDIRLTGLIFSGIIFSHLIYGLYFIRGLFSRKLSEE